MPRVTVLTPVTVAALNIRVPTTFEETDLIHFCNTTDNPITIECFMGITAGSAAGTEVFSKRILGPRADFSWPFKVKLSVAVFLSAKASAVGVTATVTTNLVTA